MGTMPAVFFDVLPRWHEERHWEHGTHMSAREKQRQWFVSPMSTLLPVIFDTVDTRQGVSPACGASTWVWGGHARLVVAGHA